MKEFKVAAIWDAGVYSPIEKNLQNYIDHIQNNGGEIISIDKAPLHYIDKNHCPFYYIVISKGGDKE